MKKEKNLVGVQGWLAFLVIILMVITPVSGFLGYYLEIQSLGSQDPLLASDPIWAPLQTYAWWSILLLSVLIFIAGYRLWQVHTKQSVRFAIFVFWVIGPLELLATALSLKFVLGVVPLDLIAEEFPSVMMQYYIFAAIWTLYLLLSRRVNNTYYRPKQTAAERGEAVPDGSLPPPP